MSSIKRNLSRYSMILPMQTSAFTRTWNIRFHIVLCVIFLCIVFRISLQKNVKLLRPLIISIALYECETWMHNANTIKYAIGNIKGLRGKTAVTLVRGANDQKQWWRVVQSSKCQNGPMTMGMTWHAILCKCNNAIIRLQFGLTQLNSRFDDVLCS